MFINYFFFLRNSRKSYAFHYDVDDQILGLSNHYDYNVEICYTNFENVLWCYEASVQRNPSQIETRKGEKKN